MPDDGCAQRARLIPNMAAARSSGRRPRALRVVAAVIRREDGEILLSRRPIRADQGGLWEFPGGKLEPRERPIAGLSRELEEELGINIVAVTPLIRVMHRYPGQTVALAVFEVDTWRGEPHGREGQRVEWLRPSELATRILPAANLPVRVALGLPRVVMVTPDLEGSEALFLRRLEHCLAAGVELVQLRIRATGARRARVARQALATCDRHGARLMLNGVPDDVIAVGAHGLHLNAERLMQYATRPLEASLLLSAACHNRSELRQAERIGVDFVYLSPVNPTLSHAGATLLGWDGLRALVRAARVPAFALGGMQPRDLRRALRAGCQGIAMLSALWRSDDPAAQMTMSKRAQHAAAYQVGERKT